MGRPAEAAGAAPAGHGHATRGQDVTTELWSEGPDEGSAGPAVAAAPPCANCGAALGERYCPRCGQAARERLVSLRRLLADFAESQFSLDAKLPRTLAGLARPGRLTREYAGGRIAPYLAPFRLYLLASVVFFLAVSSVAAARVRPMAERAQVQYEQALEAARQQGDPELFHGAQQGWQVVAVGIDPAAAPWPLRGIAGRLKAQEVRLNALPPRDGTRVYLRSIFAYAPAVLFVLVPLFALFLKVLHPRRLFVLHVIFVLHVHAFAFLIATPAVLVHAGPVYLALTLGLLAYLALALRRVYGGPRWATGARLLVLVPAYAAAGVLTLAAAAVLALLLV
jgi:hypothetical protein